MDPKYGSNGVTNTSLDIEDESRNISLESSQNVSQNMRSINQIMNNNRVINIKRDAIDFDEFDIKYGGKPHMDIPFYRTVYKVIINWWTKFSFLHFFLTLFPIIKWLPKYKIKSYLLPDFIAGMTISILHIPQGIAYSMLAGLDAVNGLYVSFFPVLIYTLMGTSRHISIGTFAVASLMLSNTASKLGSVATPKLILNATTNETMEMNWPPTTLQTLTTVCILTGFIQIAMGFLSLGSLSLILSDHLVSGFSTAVAFHVATSQMNAILGINVPNQRSGPFKLIKTWIKIGEQIPNSNIATIILSLILITILVVFKEWAEPKIKKRISFPIPIDLLVVIFSTLSSGLININKKFKVKVVGDVPTGLPDPTVPRLDFIGDVFIDCVIIGIVTFAVSLSLAKIFAKKHRYEVDPNQELIALGSANVFSSFFLAYPASAALSRSTIQERIGGKTQIAGLFSCLVILTVLLLLAPFLYHLPKCTLSCIIIIALKTMFMQILDFKNTWIVSGLDASAWLITFLSVLILDVDLGLYAGISISIFVILIRLIRPTSSVLGCLPSTEIYVDIEKYSKAKEIYGIKILRFCAPIFYLSIDNFKKRVLSLIQVFEDINSDAQNEKEPQIRFEAIIIDMSCVPFMDKSGVDALIEIIKILKENNIALCLVSSPRHIIELLERTNFFNIIDRNCIYPTIHDAVTSFR